MTINSLFFLISCLLTFLVIIITPTLANPKGFTSDLIHRDSPLSPLSTPSLNQYERLRNSIQRSLTKINRFTTSSSSSRDPQSPVKAAAGEYLMELSFGTPPVSQISIVDTGSDLIWIQCKPCLECYKQEIPIFDPRKSSTYKVQSCDSDACEALSNSQSSCTSNNTCGYTYRYGDQSHTSGVVASETITFKSKGISFPKVSFGCGNDNVGTFRNDGSGLVGLGAGPLSLVSQLDSFTNAKFSYCLIPFSKEGNYTSKISFGTIGEVSGPGVISTPIVQGGIKTFYYLNLESFIVGKTKIPFTRSSSSPSLNEDYGDTPIVQGNIIIDSGTTLTLLPSHVYFDLSSTLRDAINAETVDDPSGQFQLCYQTKNGGLDLDIPNITARFGGGADLEGGDVVLKPSNTFVLVRQDMLCFAMVSSGDQELSILGNIAQTDFLIGYDNEVGKLSFKPMDCTKVHA